MTRAPSFALFSGGHDSLCATHVSMTRGLADEVVHIATGIGVPETEDFVARVCAEQGWPLNVLEPPRSYDSLVLEFGFPGPGGHALMYRRLKERCLSAFARERKTRRGADALVYCTGVRRQESARRMRGQSEEIVVDRKRGWTWRAVILDWTKADCNRYLDAEGLPRNPVVDLLHLSGECLCGSFARPGEREEIAAWFPHVDRRIAALEERAAAAGVHACWGTRPPRRGSRPEEPGPLCSSCSS